MEIIRVKSSEEIEEIRKLFIEYEKFLNVDLCFQDFEKELAELPGIYSPPDGALLLAKYENETIGCVALKKLENEVCEMKRLYLRDKFRGKGFGRKLAMRIISEAKKRGYSIMRLDTLEKLKAAINLYVSLGFKKTEPYYNNPLPGVIYWKLDLRIKFLKDTL